MEMHWLGCDIKIVEKFGRNALVVNVQVNYLAYLKSSTPN
jgi:hypothetical protein